MGSGSKTSSTAVSIPKKFQPYFVDTFERAQAAADQVSGDPYTGAFNAPTQPLQLEGLAGREATARGQIGQGQPVFDLANATLRGDFLSPESNPYLSGTIDAATRPIFEGRDTGLQNASSAAISQGAYGGSREGLLDAQIVNDANRAAGDVASQIAFGNYAQERGYQTQAPGLLAQGAALESAPYQELGAVGDVQRAFEQQDVEEDIRRFEEANIAPFRPIFPYSSIVQGTNVGSNTSTTARGSGATGAQTGVQAGLGGASLLLAAQQAGLFA